MRFAFGLLLLLGLAEAGAQDSLRGKRYYLDAGRLTGSGVSCVDCHGGLPGGAFGIGRAANSPWIIENAVNTLAPMAPFRGRLSSADFADLAAFIGNPGVASPDLRLTTSAPPGGEAGADRIDFGKTAAGATSLPATLNFVNAGQVAMRLTSAPRVEGLNTPDFAIAATDCVEGATLMSQQSCRVDLRFRPGTGDGLRTAAARIDHDWVGGTAAIALLGTAVAASAPTPPSSPAAAPVGSDGGGGGALDGLASLVLFGVLVMRAAGGRLSGGKGRRARGS